MANDAGAVLLDGGGSQHDQELIASLIAQAVDTGQIRLHQQFSGDVRFEFTARFVRGQLLHTDASLNARRRRVYGRQ